MGREEFGPRPGEGYTAFHARLFEKAETLMARRPEQPAKTRIDALTFEAAEFGTVPGADGAAARTAGWAVQTQTQFGRVGAEVADLEVASRTAKELATDVDGATQAVARSGGLGLD
jgi:hypothetical protein